MVSVSPNPAPGFYFFDPMNIGLPGLSYLPPANAVAPPPPPTAGSPYLEDPSKKIRKPYTITKSRESWTDQERDKFLEALQLSVNSLRFFFSDFSYCFVCWKIELSEVRGKVNSLFFS